ncbi:Tn3 family transposase [Nonomuraea sp. NPDC000554]|uniref:Tn3 family transposase n=1 Tax=Nonomuraea sp. NPDC000554 TaxID=3154259 RepID=UPI0033338298
MTGDSPLRWTHATLLPCRLRSGSRKNAHYAAFREVGRVISTVQLLRYLSDAPLRRRVIAARWCRTGSTATPSSPAAAAARGSAADGWRPGQAAVQELFPGVARSHRPGSELTSRDWVERAAKRGVLFGINLAISPASRSRRRLTCPRGWPGGP